MHIVEEIDHFLKHGWFILNLLDTTPLLEGRLKLQKKLAEFLGGGISLEEYHIYGEEEAFHNHVQLEMTRFFREERIGPRILAAQRPFFEKFLGPDLMIQANPYLRMTRPQKPQDNIGYHRDTFYGGSPYELSVFIPFVELPQESSLQVLSGSHIHPADYYPTTQVVNTDPAVTKGSAKHQLGFLYAPKLMDPSIEEQMRGISLKVGQALVFTLSTVHGSIVNRGAVTRWSTDIRIMNALAPVDLSARPDYYFPFSDSPVTAVAKCFLCSKGKNHEIRDSIELELCHGQASKK